MKVVCCDPDRWEVHPETEFEHGFMERLKIQERDRWPEFSISVNISEYGHAPSILFERQNVPYPTDSDPHPMSAFEQSQHELIQRFMLREDALKHHINAAFRKALPQDVEKLLFEAILITIGARDDELARAADEPKPADEQPETENRE